MPFQKGHTPWLKGKKMTDEQKSKLDMSGLSLGHQKNEKNQSWKGDDAGYFAIHNWIRRRLGKATVCADCGKSGRCHWANISGEYRRDVTDYKSLCPSCHLAFDGYVVVPRGGCVSVV